MSDVKIIPVDGKEAVRRFLDLPFRVFADDAQWVAPLYLERLEHLDPKKNPYFAHAEVQLFLAERNGEIVGRISAQIDRLHLERYNDATGFFGFIDAVDDGAVFAALIDAAKSWLRARGITRMRGPFNFSINDEMGLLIDGFDTAPRLFMAHARPYYQERIEALGLRKAVDVLAYDYDLQAPLTPLIERASRRAEKASRISVRPIDKSRVHEELAIIMAIFNDAWSDNWGFVPFTADELKALGNNLKMLVTGGYVAIASYDGEPAAMAVTLPNINEWIVGMNGRLMPLGWAKLLPKVIAKKPRTLRLPLMGVRRKHHDTAVGSALAFSVIMALRNYHRARGVERVEMSWVLEDNKGMRNIIETAGAKAYKTYRIYEASLA
jgi:hypothetical protein